MPGWTLTWSDEFNLPDGSAVDPNHWSYDTGGSGFGNNELEYFDQPFFILLNFAVGGNWPGSPDSSTSFPQQMRVDWVRAYQPAP